MVLQPVHDIAELCSRLGVKNAILSPGSRCAPLTISFARHPGIISRVIIDERSAGFISLGISQKLQQPVAVICTSGTAVLNHGPAIAEAFYQQVPLILITADRPPEWIDQYDGQTIRQQNIFSNHTKASYQLPDQYDHPDVKWHFERKISEAVNMALEYPKGPVHINVPIREPFYPEAEEEMHYSWDLKISPRMQPDYKLPEEKWKMLESEWSNFGKILILGGQRSWMMEKIERSSLERLAQSCAVIGDLISNLHTLDGLIGHPDTILMRGQEKDLEDLQPDLLVTFGRSVISKNLKLFLRSFPPKKHWHIQAAGTVPDTFKSVTEGISVTDKHFFEKACQWSHRSSNRTYRNNWLENEQTAIKLTQDFIEKAEFGEFRSVSKILSQMPDTAVDLHLANSMPVRLTNFIGLGKKNANIRVCCNRGTSGIDGSNGVAVGEALATASGMVLLITGDLAFFYDRNAFWHPYDLSNLKIILLNNHAGGIFGLIEGPSNLPEFSEFFETSHSLTAKNVAEDYKFAYYHCSSNPELDQVLNKFLHENKGPAILEIESSNSNNKSIFSAFKKHISDNF